MSNSSIWLLDRTLSGATTPGQSGPGSNDKWRGTQHYPNIQGWSLAIGWFYVISETFVWGGILPLCRDAFSHNRLGSIVSSNYSYLIIIIICLHPVIWFQEFLSSTNNLYTIIWFQVSLSIKWYRVIRIIFQQTYLSYTRDPNKH